MTTFDFDTTDAIERHLHGERKPTSLEVWVLEVWGPHLTERGNEDWPGWDAQGSRLFEYDEVFSSVEVAKRYVAEGIGWDDMRWLRVSKSRYVGVTRGLHAWTTVMPSERVYVRLSQERVIDDSWTPG